MENNNLKDLSAKREDYYAKTRDEMLDFIPLTAKRVLDVGCGEGNFGEAVKEKMHAEVWGVELFEEAAFVAARKIDRVITGNFAAVMGKLPDRYFDCVVFNDVLEHLPDPYGVLLGIKGKLSEKGMVVASIPNVLHISVIKALLIKKNWKYESFGVLDKTHLRFFTNKSITEMFGSLGYDLVKIQGINANNSWKFMVFNIMTLGWLKESKYFQYACVAKPITTAIKIVLREEYLRR